MNFFSFCVIQLVLAVLYSTSGANGQAKEICVKVCDGADPSLISSPLRVGSTNSDGAFVVSVKFSDEDNVAVGTTEGGREGDVIWLDRSFDGGLTWEPNGSHLGDTVTKPGASNSSTGLFNVDDPANRGLGALRACARKYQETNGYCTQWARSTVLASNPTEAAATALMQYFDGKLWHTIGWWNSANAFNAIIDYMQLTGSTTHLWLVDHVFNANLDGWDGNFTSDALDDTEWWAMAWIAAYDLTKDQKYLNMAKFDSDYIYSYVDDVCGGGVWWNIYRTYKNAITNELLIQITASLHNRIPGDTKYLAQAQELWTWFKRSGMINQNNLINDGLLGNCQNNNAETWTYNQGVILGALVELYTATNDYTYISEAVKIADAVVNSARLSPNGILREPCETNPNPPSCGHAPNGCDCNAISFKGIFMRNLGRLNRVTPVYTRYIQNQIDSNIRNNRNELNQHGVHWAGPFVDLNGGNLQSALEAYVAGLPARN